MQARGEYGKAFVSMIGVGIHDMSFATDENMESLYHSDLVTPLPEHIAVKDTEIHVFYALKMGEKYRNRYMKHFASPVIHKHDLEHEELLAVHPKRWTKLIFEICNPKLKAS